MMAVGAVQLLLLLAAATLAEGARAAGSAVPPMIVQVIADGEPKPRQLPAPPPPDHADDSLTRRIRRAPLRPRLQRPRFHQQREDSHP